MTEQKIEALKKAISEKVSDVIAEISSDEGVRSFSGTLHFCVDNGWTKIDEVEIINV